MKLFCKSGPTPCLTTVSHYIAGKNTSVSQYVLT